MTSIFVRATEGIGSCFKNIVAKCRTLLCFTFNTPNITFLFDLLTVVFSYVDDVILTQNSKTHIITISTFVRRRSSDAERQEIVYSHFFLREFSKALLKLYDQCSCKDILLFHFFQDISCWSGRLE